MYPTFCDPMDFIITGVPVLHYLPEFAQIYVLWINDTIQPFYPLLLLPSIFPSPTIFSNESALLIWWPSIGASASVLPVNIQGWFPLGLTGLISLQSKGLSKVSRTTIQEHRSLVLSLLYGLTFISIHDYWDNHTVFYTDLCQ